MVQINQAVLADAEIRYLAAALLELLARVEHGLVLRHDRDDVVAALGVHLRDAFDRKVVGFRRATGEDDFFRVCRNQFRDLLPRTIYGLLRFPPERVVAAGRVAELACQIGHHGLEHPRIERRRGVIIHVNRRLHFNSKTVRGTAAS